jgi:hypothetical protein
VETETVPIQYRVTMDAAMAKRCARAYGRYVISRPAVLVIVVACAVIFAGGAAVNWLSSGDRVIAVVFTVFFLFWAVGYPLLALRGARRRLQRQLVLGAQYGTGYSPDALRVESPLTRGETSYAAYRALIVRDGAVFLRLRNRNAYSILPAELMPPAAQQLVRAGLAQAAPQPAPAA